MSAVNILKFGTSSPADTSPLDELKRAGYDASHILAVIGKTEGNGCVNDFSRTLAALAWEPLLPPDAITIFSGGTEGVLSPHVTFVVREPPGVTTGLVAAVARTRAFLPHEIGTRAQASEVASEIERAAAPSAFGTTHLVLVKCPLLTSAKIAAIRAKGRIPLTTDTYESMALSRYASALGVKAALARLSADSSHDNNSATILSTLDATPQPPLGTLWSAHASCSSGAELEDSHILLLGSTPSPGPLRCISTLMTDALDSAPLLSALSTIRSEGGTVVQIFAKAEADPSGSIRGARHTMATDSDLHSTRHARAAVGGLVAGLAGDARVYVSGGAEGQGPPGGGGICVVYRVPGP